MSRAAPKLVDTAESARQQLLAGLDVNDHIVDLAGIPTAILETGDGPPLVLLHGPGEFKERWVRVIPGLSRTHSVIAPDFPGHGQSGTCADSLDADRVFAWIDALLDNRCRDHPVLVGATSSAAQWPPATLRPGQTGSIDWCSSTHWGSRSSDPTHASPSV